MPFARRDSVFAQSLFPTIVTVGILMVTPTIVEAQQSGTVSGTSLLGQIVTEDSGEPVPATLVTVLGVDRRTLTDTHGRVLMSDLEPGEYEVRIEQLGFVSRDTVVEVGTSAEPLTIQIAREAIKLPTIMVRPTERRCDPQELSSALDREAVVAITEEARKNAVRYRVLVDDYPFELRYERVRQYLKDGGEVVGTRTDTIYRSSTDLHWSYEPGSALVVSVTEAGDTSYTLPTPSAYALSNTLFQESHCFQYGGMERLDQQAQYRIDFDPLPSITGPEVGGSLYLDSISFVLERATYRFVNLPDDLHFSEVVVEVAYQAIAPGLVLPRTMHMSQNLERVRFSGTRVHVYTEDYRLLDTHFIGPAPGADHPALRRDPSPQPREE